MKEKMILIILILLCIQLQNKAQELELPRTCYISTGDRDWKTGLPVDSKATIENVIEALATKFDVNRILWRSGQDDMWFRYYKPFEKNRSLWEGYNQQISWLRNEVGTSRIAMQAAHKWGMEVWLHTGLFAHGGPPDGRAEDLIRIKYPDCVPVNKYGTRRQDNLIEFCHSAARESLVKRYTGFLVENGYDGIIFYTYAEDICLRYMDEFGYNQPIVEEYKRRYGKDILTEDFDKEAWARVRGDYVTLFLRELALEALTRYSTDTQVVDAILNALQDKDEVVQVNAAECLSRVLTAPESPKEVRAEALKVLIEFFREYGDGCIRPDADWGWRRVGDAILTFGSEGKQEFLTMMQQKKDVRLAELAWRIVYLPLRKTRGKFEITEEQDKEAHSLYPHFELFSN